MLRAFNRVRDQRWTAVSGDLAGAVDNLLDHYEEYGERSLRLAALDRDSAAMAALASRARRLHYDWVEHAFGPLLDRARGKARARLRAALIALCDVQTWRLLAHDLGLPRAEVRATLVQAIEGLTEEKR